MMHCIVFSKGQIVLRSLEAKISSIIAHITVAVDVITKIFPSASIIDFYYSSPNYFGISLDKIKLSGCRGVRSASEKNKNLVLNLTIS
jgi:hypothetical protein